MRVARAIEALAEHITPLLPPEAVHDSNHFRSTYCYLGLVEDVLVKHQPTLRALFDHYAALNADLSDVLQSKRLVSIGEWLTFVDDLGLIANGQVSELRAKMLSMCSRIRGSADHTAKALRKLRNLSFEDFLEAIIRLSLQLVFPNDEEIEEGGASDAGQYLIALENAGMLTDFITERQQPWGKPPAQRVWRCLEHLMCYVARVVESDTTRKAHGETDMKIAPDEIAEFEKRRRTSLVRTTDTAAMALGATLAESEARVRAKLFEGLRAVDIFSALSEEQLLSCCATGWCTRPSRPASTSSSRTRRATPST
eukprot:155706-Prymnesium_polylepis.1